MNLQKNCGILACLDALREPGNLVTLITILIPMVVSKPVLDNVTILVGQDILLKGPAGSVPIIGQPLDLIFILLVLHVPKARITQVATQETECHATILRRLGCLDEGVPR